MRAFGRIESTFWQNRKVRTLSESARLLLLYVYSCPHGNSVGCFILPDGYISADMGWPAEQVSKRVSELVVNGFIERDDETSLTKVTGWFGHNTIENANVAKAAIKTLHMLPKGGVYHSLIKEMNELRNAFIDPLFNEFRNELGNEYRTPKPNLAEPENTEASASVLPTAAPTTSPEDPKRAKRAKPKTIFPDDWQPSPEDRTYAAERGFDPDAEASACKNSSAANDRRYADHSKAFRGWVDKAVQFAAERANRGGRGRAQRQPASLSQIGAEVTEALARREQQASESQPGDAGSYPLPAAYGEPGAGWDGPEIDDRELVGGTGGVPDRRDQDSPTEMGQVIEVVADSGGDPRGVHVASGAPPLAAEGDDPLDIPPFLDRRAPRR